jgi:WD40 repeat protein
MAYGIKNELTGQTSLLVEGLTFNSGAPSGRTLRLLAANEIWDIPSGKSIYRVPSFDFNWSLSPDGQILFSNGALLNLLTKKSTQLENPAPQYVSGVPNDYYLVSFSNDGTLVAAAKPNGSLYLLNSATGKVVNELRGGGETLSRASDGEKTCLVSSLAFSPDDTVLASGELNGNISLWKTKTGDLFSTLAGSDGQLCQGIAPQSLDLYSAIPAVGFSPDGHLLASEDFYGVVRIWQVSTGKVLYTLPFHAVPLKAAVHFSPDGRFLVTSGNILQKAEWHEEYLVWNPASGHLLEALSLPGEGTFGFTSDGELVTAQFYQGRIEVQNWALRTRFRIPFVSSAQEPAAPSDPALLRSYEDRALQALEFLQENSGRYMNGEGRGSFPHTLEDLAGSLVQGRQEFREENRGYRYLYTPGPVDAQGNVTTYVVSARPLVYGQTGKRSFLVDQTGQVRATSENREATAADPVIPALLDATHMAPAPQNAAATQNTPGAEGSQGQGASSSNQQATAPTQVPTSTASELAQWLSRAEAQYQQGDYRGALQSCDAALRLDPNNDKVKELKAKVESTMSILGGH